MQKSMSLTYEPSSEPLHISAKTLQVPEYALAGESVLPNPRVSILDAGGNVANVSEEVRVRVVDGPAGVEVEPSHPQP